MQRRRPTGHLTHTSRHPLQAFLRAGLGGTALALLPLLTLAAVAQAAPLTQEATSENVSIWPVLLPLLTASVGIERAIEVFWNYVDWIILNFRGGQPAQLKSPQYLQFKSGTSLVLGIVIGILVSNFTGMRLLEYLRPLVPAFLDNVPVVWDVVLTGVIIGSGSKPAHDILGIITQFKNFLANSAIRQREAASAALAEGVLKLAQSDAQAMIEVPGVGPARLATPAGSRALDEEESGEAGPETTPTERYIALLYNRTSM